MEGVVAGYKNANIPLECVWNDLDIYELYRDFTNNAVTYPVEAFQAFIASLHANGQHYIPIIDSNIYVPNPLNESDAYPPFERGASLETYIRDPTTGDFYYGDNWPGFSVWADWLVSSSQAWWTNEIVMWHNDTSFDGIWIDLNEPSSFCVGSCGNGRIEENPLHPPFLLPNDPYQTNYNYPEGFNVSNATEASSVTSASASQASYLMDHTLLPVATTTTQGRTNPTPGVKNLNFPPYVLNAVQAGHSLLKGTVAPNATHNDAFNTTEYYMHNLFGYQISNATYHALLSVFPNKRPFTVGRSVFAGSGRFTGHWGGDNTSTWGSMFLSISQALTFMMSGMPMFGADTCGFSGNTDFDLCSRWMELSAFFPFYRNHSEHTPKRSHGDLGHGLTFDASLQTSRPPYRKKPTCGHQSLKRPGGPCLSATGDMKAPVTQLRHRKLTYLASLLTYMYTLFYYAHTQGDTVMRALSWEFPNDPSLAGTFSQFMLGPSLLITPVLIPNVDTVNGTFPGIGAGTNWYDWYTLQPVVAQPQENVTLAAPLEHINVHVRGGSILPLQTPALTTAATRNNPYSLVVALDESGEASGSLYLDDGESLVQNATKLIQFSYTANCLSTTINGTYTAEPPLANVTIAGAPCLPKSMSLTIAGQPCEVNDIVLDYSAGVLYVSGIEQFTPAGAWEGEMKMEFSY
ncbi:hypothetical protein LTR53_013741 [Teratosphaeriaceae sp. CCFEE 6253]|nr:hypothetical protein LTR53_013741 [Teratosphaeriaceae sp. CCFEE 6253]